MRALLATAGFVGGFFVDPWVVLICMGILALRYAAWEILLIGVLMDFLWLPMGILHPVPLFTLASFILAWGMEPLRNEFLFR